MNLQPHDGMSIGKSTHEERKNVLEVLGEHTQDRENYGFFIGELSLKPVADYANNMVRNEINENNLALM